MFGTEIGTSHTCVQSLATNRADIDRVPAHGDQVASSLLHSAHQPCPPLPCSLHGRRHLCRAPVCLCMQPHLRHPPKAASFGDQAPLKSLSKQPVTAGLHCHGNAGMQKQRLCQRQARSHGALEESSAHGGHGQFKQCNEAGGYIQGVSGYIFLKGGGREGQRTFAHAA